MSGSVYLWSTTAASNANADPDVNFAEGQAPSTVNNSARQVMGRVAEYVADQGGALTVGGTANALTVTGNSAFTAYQDGLKLKLRIVTDNTTAATLNVNALGVKSIRKMVTAGESALTGTEMQATGIYDFVYSTALNSTAGGWLLLNPTIDLSSYATLASPILTGNPTAPTPIAGDNDTSIATTAFVTGGIATAIAALSSVYQAASARLTALVAMGTAVAGDIVYASGADTWARLPKGAAGKTLRMNSGATAPEWGGSNGPPDAVLEDQKASGVDGGTFTSGAWRQRDLNTEVRDPSGLLSISANTFVPTVDGWVEWSAVAYDVGTNQTRLFNVTDGAAVGYGTSQYTSGASSSISSVGGVAVLAGKTYRIEHRSIGSKSTTGFGNSAGVGGTEVYTRVLFWRT
ncbi:hypothetical protein NKH85_16275 [Mesorhizobium sp. M0924]|uniref:hypothetical protein n=1 Tax=unclassified Mesorhizobium TaxID=325217 RepID=UPI003339BA06